ncbi:MULTISPECIES: 4'-phosphopantetheinyl transferase superfamily protein [unclassified Streptomyces]|uniref:4'-phosphopantetheinyl transferase family protein n=1 Tax=unclassified Streptomyces TaxID=2593676 RepID=UPI0033C17300
MIERLLPNDVAAVEAFRDPAGLPAEYLYPQEAAVVARAVEKRKREFSTVRVCARRALSMIGHAPAPLLPDRRGAPIWPTRVTGSMTHCDGYRAAAVAGKGIVASIGIDAEPNARLPAGVLDLVALADERDCVKQLLDDNPEACWDRLLLSAKESVFKAWYPLTQSELGFDQARINFACAPGDPTVGTFTAELLVHDLAAGGHRLSDFAGKWLCHAGYLVTAVVVRSASHITKIHRPCTPAEALNCRK